MDAVRKSRAARKKSRDHRESFFEKHGVMGKIVLDAFEMVGSYDHILNHAERTNHYLKCASTFISKLRELATEGFKQNLRLERVELAEIARRSFPVRFTVRFFSADTDDFKEIADRVAVGIIIHGFNLRGTSVSEWGTFNNRSIELDPVFAARAKGLVAFYGREQSV